MHGGRTMPRVTGSAIRSRLLAIVLGGSVAGCAGTFVVPPDAEVLTTIGEAPASLFGPRIRVLVWNVYKGKRRGWDEDLARLARDRDLVLVQEAYLPAEGTTPLAREPRLRWTVATSFRFARRGGAATGVATGSVDEPVATTTLRSPDREPITNTPKMALATEHDLPGSSHDLLVVNVHGINYGRYHKLERQLDALEAHMRGHAGPLLLAGDFNTRSRRRARRLEALVRRLGLEPIVFEPDHRVRSAGRILDHAFVRGLDVERAFAPKVRSSDHRPLVFEVRIRRPAAGAR